MSNFAPAVDNAIRIIEGLADETEPVGVSELSRKLGINKNMIFRILNSLEANGWVYCANPSDKKYQLSLLPFKISSQILGKLSFTSVATPILRDLWKETGEYSYLSIKSDDKQMHIQHLEGTGNIRVSGKIGATYDMYCTAPGKVLLAYSSDEFIQTYTARKFKKHTETTLTTKTAILAEIKNIKAQGYATDNEEMGKGILCLAAPIFDHTGVVIGAIGCSVSTVAYDFDGAVKFLKKPVTEAAKKISTILGNAK